MQQDLMNNIKLVQTIAPITKTTGLSGDTTEGTGVDTAGYESCTFHFNIGAAVDTSDADYKLQESADNITFTDVASTDIIGSDTILSLTNTTGANATLKKGYIGTKRYVRAYLTITTGGSGSWPHAVTVILGHARKAPVA